MPEADAVNVRNRSHADHADITIAAAGQADGVLLALGSALGGWSLHILAGRLRYVHNLYGKERHVDRVGRADPAGDHRVEYEFTKDDGLGGTGVLRCDGREVGPRPDPAVHPVRLQRRRRRTDLRLRVGARRRRGLHGPVPVRRHHPPRRCAHTGPVVRDPLAELEAILSQQ